MIKYNAHKIPYILCVFFIYYILRAFFWQSGLEGDPIFAGMETREILLNMFQGGYFGTLEQVLISTLIYIVALEYLLRAEREPLVIRSRSRGAYLRKDMAQLALLAAIMTFIKFAVGWASLLLQIGGEALFTGKVYAFVLWGIILFGIYTFRCGVMYLIFKSTLNKRNTAMLVTILIYLLSFYTCVDRWFYSIIHIKWMPFLDLMLPFEIYAEVSPHTLLFAGMGRQAAITAIYLAILFQCWERKDLFGFEKK